MFRYTSLLAVAQAATEPWNYEQNGDDWPEIAGYEACAGKNQSPINLETNGNYKVYEKHDDAFSKIYSNQYARTVVMNGHTSQTALNTETTNTFKS
jgi:carbonic anhydrase